jgi:TfoX/Sxy family transcriptional regulator of competence genes
MPFDPGLAARLEDVVATRFAHIRGLGETRMFGGFGYMLNGNMCIGIHKDTLIVRIGLEKAAEIIGEPGVRPMDLTGKAMKGWAAIEPKALAGDAGLERYCAMAIGFVSTLPGKR